MLKLYDTECKECGQRIEQYKEDNESFDNCPVCSEEMTRVFTTFNYRLVYNNKKDVCGWADNHYQSSQYWKNVKQQREQGYDVKPAEEE